MPQTAEQAKQRFEKYSARLLHLFSFVPDDKLNWAPSPTAKSSLRIVAHCGLTSAFFADLITGKMPEKMPTPDKFLQSLHDAEETISTREDAIALVKATTADLCSAIDTVNAKNIDTVADSPFGALPLRFWIDQGSAQMAGHAGQLEYLQTVWGDLDNYLG